MIVHGYLPDGNVEFVVDLRFPVEKVLEPWLI